MGSKTEALRCELESLGSWKERSSIFFLKSRAIDKETYEGPTNTLRSVKRANSKRNHNALIIISLKSL
jgi:hypothetical protein